VKYLDSVNALHKYPQKVFFLLFLHQIRDKKIGSFYLQAEEAFEIIPLYTHLPDSSLAYWPLSL